MSKRTNDDEQVHEGTESLQAIADDLVAERERAGRSMDDADKKAEAETAGETREDHLEPEVDTPLDDRLDEQK
ncbi:hypothetical protein ACNI3K_05275 [Demequina sp. SO4-13]|uniref:hypothetical protein n=1 Tax=Demequina sp. SO4-13 TaxID=3401027 RepID=UPI003AF4B505